MTHVSDSSTTPKLMGFPLARLSNGPTRESEQNNSASWFGGKLNMFDCMLYGALIILGPC